MGFLDYFSSYFNLLYELVGILLILWISAHLSERVRKLTRIVVVLLLVESLAYYVEYWTRGLETLSPARPILTAVVYSIYPVILFFVTRLIVPERQPWKKSVVTLLPALVLMPVYFTTQWTHLICYFTADNRFQRGPLTFTPYVIFTLYGLYFLYKNFTYFRKYSRRERIFTIYLVVTPLAGTVFKLISSTEDDYSALFTSSILLYFVSLCVHMAKIDPLTSLLNRQTFYQTVKRDEKAITALVSVDMNDLKYYNDNHGHQAGDEALVTIAGVLRENCGPEGTVYRTGGDEFMILYTGANEERVAEAVSAIRKKMAETPYVCAFGYAMTAPGKTVDGILKEADQKMYADKQSIKTAKLAQGEERCERT